MKPRNSKRRPSHPRDRQPNPTSRTDRLFIPLLVVIVALPLAVFVLLRAHRGNPIPAQPTTGAPATRPADAPERRNPHEATKDRPWANSLTMRFVPVPVTGNPTAGKTILFSIWETRKADWRRFADDKTAYAAAGTAVNDAWRETKWNRIPVSPGDDDPVVNVSWEGATKFCEWLTTEERKEERIGPGDQYRLPDDHEWSCAVGIGDREDPRQCPKDKHAKLKDVFPWGNSFPPPAKVGNFADAALKRQARDFGAIKNYDDGYATTSPVGKFDANPRGLFDLGGNVWEWCRDNFDGSPSADHPKTLRGGGWRGEDPEFLLSSARVSDRPTGHRSNHGFRIVLELAE